MVILSSHLVPVWEEMVQDDYMEVWANVGWEMFSNA